MGKKDWERINRTNARRLREVLSSEEIHFLGGIYGAIYLRKQSGLDYRDLLDQAEEYLPKNFNNTYYWVRLAYEMSQGQYGGISSLKKRSTTSQNEGPSSEEIQMKQFLSMYGGDIDSWGGLEEILRLARGD